MKKPHLLTLLIFTAALWLLSGCALLSGGQDAPLEDDPWGHVTIPKGTRAKIGVAADLTGPYSSLGAGIQSSVELAVSDHRTRKGRLLFEIIAEDDICQRGRGYLVARAFAQQPETIGVVGHMCGDSMRDAIPIYTEAKMPALSPSSTAPYVTATGSPVVFRTSWNDIVQARRAAEYAATSLGIKSAAVVHDATPYGASLAEEFRKRYQDEGEVVLTSRQVVSFEDQPLSELAEELKSMAPSLVYFAGLGKNGAALAAKLRSAGITAALMGPDSLLDRVNFLGPAGTAAEGAYVTRVKLPQSDRFEEWQKRYETAYRTTLPAFTFSPQAYDAAAILMEAAEKVAVKRKDGSILIGRKALVDAVRATDHEGVTGRINFDAAGDRTEVVIEVGRVVNGEVRTVE